MKPAIVLLLFASLTFGQEKPKDVKLSHVKITERLTQVQKAIEDRQNKILSEDVPLQQLISYYRGLQAALTDSTLAVTDSLPKPRK